MLLRQVFAAFGTINRLEFMKTKEYNTKLLTYRVNNSDDTSIGMYNISYVFWTYLALTIYVLSHVASYYSVCNLPPENIESFPINGMANVWAKYFELPYSMGGVAIFLIICMGNIHTNTDTWTCTNTHTYIKQNKNDRDNNTMVTETNW